MDIHQEEQIFDLEFQTLRRQMQLYINLSPYEGCDIFGITCRFKNIKRKLHQTKETYTSSDLIQIKDSPFVSKDHPNYQNYVSFRVFCNEFVFPINSTQFTQVVDLLLNNRYNEYIRRGSEQSMTPNYTANHADITEDAPLEDFLTLADINELFSLPDNFIEENSEIKDNDHMDTQILPTDNIKPNRDETALSHPLNSKALGQINTTDNDSVSSEENIDIKSLRMECQKCHCTKLCKSKGQHKRRISEFDTIIRGNDKNAAKNARDRKAKNIKSLYASLKSITDLLDQDLAYICTEYYSTYDGLCELKLANHDSLTKLKSNINDIVPDHDIDPDMMLWIKDHAMLSDKTYKLIYTLLRAPTTLQKFHLVNNARERWNDLTTRSFGMKSTKDGTRVNIRFLVEHILKLYKKQAKDIPRYVIFKLCVDGRTIGNGQTAFAIVPINLRKVFGTQDVNSVFVFTVYKGSDSYEDISANISTSREELQDLENKGVDIDGDIIYISFLHNSDLKALGECSNLYDDDHMCPFCDCKLHERFNIRDRSAFSKRQIIDLFGIKNHMICCLHCKQRITEFYIKHMVRGDEQKMKKIETVVQNDLKLGNFKLIEKKSKVDESILGYSVKMLKGDECDIIIENYMTIIDAIQPSPLLRIGLENAWKLFKKIKQNYLEANSDQIKLINFEVMETDLNNWVLVMKETFTMKDSMPHYVHIIWAHLPDIIREYGSLLPFSNQGFENSHQTHDRIWTNMVSKGGRVKKGSVRITPICQLMQYCTRRILMTISLTDSRWGKVYLDPETQQKRQENAQQKKEAALLLSGKTIIQMNDEELNEFARRVYEENSKAERDNEGLQTGHNNIKKGKITGIELNETLNDSDDESEGECVEPIVDKIREYKQRIQNITKANTVQQLNALFTSDKLKNLGLSSVPKGTKEQKATAYLGDIRNSVLTELRKLTMTTLKSYATVLQVLGIIKLYTGLITPQEEYVEKKKKI